MQQAVDKLYNDKHIRLWVVYVDTFSGQDAVSWAAEHHERLSDFGDQDALLAVATTGPGATRSDVPTAASPVAVDVTDVRRNDIEPALRQSDWAGAAVAAANGLNTPTSSTGAGDVVVRLLVVAFAVLALAILLLWLWMRRRRRKRREAEFAAAQPRRSRATRTRWPRYRSTPSTTCPSRSSSTSTTRCAPATTNWLWPSRNSAPTQTAPFSHAVANAKTTLAQAFNVRQILDDAVPETAAAAARPADAGGRRRGEGRPRAGRADAKRSNSCAIW